MYKSKSCFSFLDAYFYHAIPLGEILTYAANPELPAGQIFCL